MKLKISKPTYSYGRNHQTPFHFSQVFEAIVLGENRKLNSQANNIIIYIRDRNFV